jgi:type IV secretory pathway VirB4 component
VVVKFSRVLKDYREAGSVNGLLALWGFVEDCTFLTKTGAVGLAFRLQGVDYECLDHAQRQAIAQRFEHALRQLDESFRIYQYVIKRPARPIAAAAHPHAVVNEALKRRTAYLDASRESSHESALDRTPRPRPGEQINAPAVARTASAQRTNAHGLGP